MNNKNADKTTCDSGMIFNIQRFSVHDGPGIRSVVFLKGCPLRCIWCSNPESQKNGYELGYSAERCIGYDQCGHACENVCPRSAITSLEGKKIYIDREICDNCGQCAQKCPANALHIFGEKVSVDYVLRQVEEDTNFYQRSGGGITLSGGEPLSQPEFAYSLLKQCHEHKIHTGLETSGYADWSDLSPICEYLDFILYDIKHIDPASHRKFTTLDNELILSNIERLGHSFPDIPIKVRTPVIPGFNDSRETIREIIEFLQKCKNVKEYELLPYHGFGESKYCQLGRKYLLKHLKTNKEQVAYLKKVASEFSDSVSP